jgi:hypothetical protein
MASRAAREINNSRGFPLYEQGDNNEQSEFAPRNSMNLTYHFGPRSFRISAHDSTHAS